VVRVDWQWVAWVVWVAVGGIGILVSVAAFIAAM